MRGVRYGPGKDTGCGRRIQGDVLGSAGGTGSEELHVVPAVPELPYLYLAAKEGAEDFLE